MSGAQFLPFLRECTSAFHTVIQCKNLLAAAGFQELKETDEWVLPPAGKFYIIRGCSIIAFAIGGQYEVAAPFKIIGAHTDFPCLKIKPVSAVFRPNCLSVGVQPYGGGIWTTWFDRDLSISGRVIVAQDGKLNVLPLTIHRPLLRIPNLGIHLDREASKNFNPQCHLLPILSSLKGRLDAPVRDGHNHHPLLLKLIADELHVPTDAIVDFDLSLYDFQDPVIGGALGEYVYGQHLDNTLMTFCAIQGFIDGMASLPTEKGVRICASFDHEEVGSRSAEGADAITLQSLMARLTAILARGAEGALERSVRNSMVISADVAHSLHPNYSEKHDEKHGCVMGAGPVIKYDSNQKYSTNIVTSAVLTELARLARVPVQRFMVRNDSPTGSTIGPAIASGCQISVADLGIAMLSMHSIREQCAVEDIDHTVALFRTFYERYGDVASSMQIKM